MIRNNFNILMAERQLKITRVANDTHLSRTTLTALSQEQSKGVQLDTLNTLCNYFNITPCEFFDYIPFEFSVNVVNSEDEKKFEELGDFAGESVNYDLFINVYNNRGLKLNTYSLNCTLFAEERVITFEMNDEENKADDKIEKYALFKIYNKTDDEESFLEFLNNNFSVQWRKYILDYIENYLSPYLRAIFDGSKIENELKELI